MLVRKALQKLYFIQHPLNSSFSAWYLSPLGVCPARTPFPSPDPEMESFGHDERRCIEAMVDQS